MRRTLICFIAGIFLSAPTVLSAQQNPCLQRSFLVSAVDKEGKALTGLTAENFKGKFRGKPVRVLSVQDRNIIPRIVILLDSSGSMLGAYATKWKLASMLVDHLTLAFRQEAEIALIVFSDHIRHEVGFEQPRQAITDVITSMQGPKPRTIVSGRTALYAAILRATELLKPGRRGDVIYIVSDGWENASKADYRDVERAVLNSGARVFATMLVARPPSPPAGAVVMVTGDMGLADLQNLVKASGGYITGILSEEKNRDPYYRFTGARGREIALLLDYLYRRMWELTEVEIELPREVDKPRTWKLELVSTPDVSAKGATLIYPKKLAPCTP